jgi:hypothetical protein
MSFFHAEHVSKQSEVTPSPMVHILTSPAVSAFDVIDLLKLRRRKDEGRLSASLSPPPFLLVFVLTCTRFSG